MLSRRPQHFASVALFVAATLGLASAVRAQKPDTLPAVRPKPDTIPAVRALPAIVLPKEGTNPPISPRRAFLYSLAVPGSAQSILDRPGAGALFVTVEAGSLVMIMKSVHDLKVARRLAADSIIVGFDSLGVPQRQVSPLAVRVRPRRTFVEDWVTLLIVNHFISGADAYVAANLWDVPTDVAVEPAPGRRMAIVARFKW